MAYASINMVRQRLDEELKPERDTELSSCITRADAIIDTALGRYVSVPLSSPPQIIKEISADMAAGFYTQRRAPHEKIALIEQAKELLKQYIYNTYLKDAFIAAETGEIT